MIRNLPIPTPTPTPAPAFTCGYCAKRHVWRGATIIHDRLYFARVVRAWFYFFHFPTCTIRKQVHHA